MAVMRNWTLGPKVLCSRGADRKLMTLREIEGGLYEVRGRLGRPVEDGGEEAKEIRPRQMSRQPLCCGSGCLGDPWPERCPVGPEGLGGGKCGGEGAWMSLAGLQGQPHSRTADPVASEDSRKTPDLEPSDLAQKWLPGGPLRSLLPSPRPALTQVWGLFVPAFPKPHNPGLPKR